MNREAVVPLGQSGARRVAHAVAGVVDVGEEDETAAGKTLLDEVDHLVEPLLERLDPRPRLLERRPVHRALRGGVRP